MNRKNTILEGKITKHVINWFPHLLRTSLYAVEGISYAFGLFRTSQFKK